MPTVEELVDTEVLDRLVNWCEGFPNFKRSHAADSLFVAERYLGSRAKSDKEELFLVALDVTFWYWFDDRIDEKLSEEGSVVGWASLFEAFEADPEKVEGHEARFIAGLSRLLKGRSAPEDFEWWFRATEGTLRAFRTEDSLSRGGKKPSFVEYLENGSWSATIRNILATLSALYPVRWANRRNDPEMSNLERYLCLVVRLENDAYSFEKERREGCTTNAVLLLEDFMSDKARGFVEDQKNAYERLLLTRLESLPPNDLFAEFALAMLDSHRQWYALRPVRYEAAKSSAARAG